MPIQIKSLFLNEEFHFDKIIEIAAFGYLNQIPTYLIIDFIKWQHGTIISSFTESTIRKMYCKWHFSTNKDVLREKIISYYVLQKKYVNLNYESLN